MLIEDMPLAPSTRQNGLTAALSKMKVGQSAWVETSYWSAMACIRQARSRKKSPLTGEFRVIAEGDGVRVGRTA